MQEETHRPAIYISYAWGSESEAVAELIENEFLKKGLPIRRDKNVLGYKGRIKAFMEQIGRAKYIILVISNKYLRSANCMFELIQIFKNEHFYDRIFPVVLDEVNIYDASERVRLMKYWEDKTESLNDEIRELRDFTNIQGITDDLNLTSEIRDDIARLTDILKDTNTLTVGQLIDSNFGPLYRSVRKKIEVDEENVTDFSSDKEAINNSGENSGNILLGITAKLFGTNAFLRITKKNRRRIISFGITAMLGIGAVLLALPSLFQGSEATDSPDMLPPVIENNSSVFEKNYDSLRRAQIEAQEKPEIETKAAVSNIRYNVELIVPSYMAGADVFVDGKPAEIIDRSPISITVRIRKKASSHRFEVKDEGEVCKTDKLVSKDNLRLTLCD